MAWERDSLLHQLTLAHTHSYTCTAALPPSDDPRDEMAAGLVARMPQLAQNLPQTEVQSLPHSLPPSLPPPLPLYFNFLFTPSPPLLSPLFFLLLLSFLFPPFLILLSFPHFLRLFFLPSSFLQSSFPSFFNFSFCSSFSYHQVPWMPLPEESAPPGCPPGLEYLTQIDQILVHQLIEIFECKNLRLCTCISRLRTQHITSYIPCI